MSQDLTTEKLIITPSSNTLNKNQYLHKYQSEISLEKILFDYENEELKNLFNKIFSIIKIDLKIELTNSNKSLLFSLSLKMNQIENEKEKENKLILNKTTEENINYYINLHKDYVLFKRTSVDFFQIFLNKIQKGNFNLKIKINDLIIKSLKYYFNLNENLNQSEIPYQLENFKNFIEFDLLFNLDENEINLNIPLKETILLNDLNNNRNNDDFPIISKYLNYTNNNKDTITPFFDVENFCLEISETQKVRKATEKDTDLIYNFIREIADFEELLHTVSGTAEIFHENAFNKKYAEVMIYEIDGKPVSFAMFLHTFSSFTCRPCLYLEDIYVKPEYRHKGIGTDFFKILAKIAIERKCPRFEWVCLLWNKKAIQFYEKLGAVAQDEWVTFRMEDDAIKKLADMDL
jgi:GNAT superfamily N-acetyltransferase